MPIFDLSQNALPLATTSQLIGYEEATPEEEILNLKMYDFLIQPIRTEDQLRGDLFVKRLLEGPQIIWRETQEAIFKITNLTNADEIEDVHLKYLAPLVGWTSELSHIVDRLDYRQLRQLIRASGALWKTRGPESSIEAIIRQLAGARVRIWNWFDYRWIVDETGIGAESDGRDPWMIGAPGSGLSDEFRFNVRVADDGDLDQQLVIDVIKLMRPTGERVEITFIDFLDLFSVDDDIEQWNAEAGAFSVVDGTMNLGDSGTLQVVATTRADAPTWEDSVTFTRVRGTSALAGNEFGLFVCYTDINNNYSISLDTVTDAITLNKTVAGVVTLLATSPIPAIVPEISAGIYYGIRVESMVVAGTNTIKVFIDNEMVIDTTDTSFTSGNFGLFSQIGAVAEFDEVEMFQLPLTIFEADVNS